MSTNEKPRNGIVYVAIGDPAYSRMCLNSISSLRDFGYEDEILIITDQTGVPWPKAKTIVHPVTGDNSKQASRFWKTQLGQMSPFAKNIYLDCDTMAVAHMKDIWSEVREEGIGFALEMFSRRTTFERADTFLDESGYYLDGLKLTEKELNPEKPRYNSGVIFWNTSAITDRFFYSWHREWNRSSRREQFALTNTIQSTGIPVYTLENIYNFQMVRHLTLAQAINRKVQFVHFTYAAKESDSFLRQMTAFRALSAKCQEKFFSIVTSSRFRDDQMGVLLPLMLSFSISDILHSIQLIFWTAYSAVQERCR